MHWKLVLEWSLWDATERVRVVMGYGHVYYIEGPSSITPIKYPSQLFSGYCTRDTCMKKWWFWNSEFLLLFFVCWVEMRSICDDTIHICSTSDRKYNDTTYTYPWLSLYFLSFHKNVSIKMGNHFSNSAQYIHIHTYMNNLYEWIFRKLNKQKTYNPQKGYGTTSWTKIDHDHMLKQPNKQQTKYSAAAAAEAQTQWWPNIYLTSQRGILLNCSYKSMNVNAPPVSNTISAACGVWLPLIQNTDVFEWDVQFNNTISHH